MNKIKYYIFHITLVISQYPHWHAASSWADIEFRDDRMADIKKYYEHVIFLLHSIIFRMATS